MAGHIGLVECLKLVWLKLPVQLPVLIVGEAEILGTGDRADGDGILPCPFARGAFGEVLWESCLEPLQRGAESPFAIASIEEPRRIGIRPEPYAAR